MPEAPAASPLRKRLVPVVDGLLVGAGVLLLLRTPRFPGGDGQVRLDAVRALASGKIPEMSYSLVMPAAALPVKRLGDALGREESVLYLFNGVLLAVMCLCLWLLLREIDGALTRRLILLVVFGSMLPAHVNSFYGETFTTAAVVVGLASVTLSASALVRGLGWGLSVLGIANTPAALPAFALVVLVHVLRTRRPWGIVALGATAAIIALDLRLRTGGFSSPYEGNAGFPTVLPYSGRPGFSYPFAFGVLAILLSFGKGLLFFTPGLFLPVRRRMQAHHPRLLPLYVLLVVATVGLVVVYSRWWAWYGGYFWGPRFFLVVSVAAALVLAVRLSTPESSVGGALLTLVALTLSTWVAVTAVLGNVGQDICLADGYALEFLCWYSPEFSVLWQPAMNWPPTTVSQRLFIALAVVTYIRLSAPLYAGFVRGSVAQAPSLLAERWVDVADGRSNASGAVTEDLAPAP